MPDKLTARKAGGYRNTTLTVRAEGEEAARQLAFMMKRHLDKKTLVLCVGTDICIADCLGPLVGSLLKKRRVPLSVIGSLEEPVHAVNFQQRIAEIKQHYIGYRILAVDAALTKRRSRIGSISFELGGLLPGIGAGNMLEPVGDMHITGIVNTKFITPFMDIRLSLVMQMADVIARAIELARQPDVACADIASEIVV